MTAQTKQEELSIRNRIVNCFDGDFRLPNKSLDNLEKLINSEVLSVLEELEQKSQNGLVRTQDYGQTSDGVEQVVKVTEIQSIKNRYKL